MPKRGRLDLRCKFGFIVLALFSAFLLWFRPNSKLYECRTIEDCVKDIDAKGGKSQSLRVPPSYTSLLRFYTWCVSAGPDANSGRLLSITADNKEVVLYERQFQTRYGRCWMPWALNTTHLYYSCTTSDTDFDHESKGQVCVFDKGAALERCFEVMGLSHDITYSRERGLFYVSTTVVEDCDLVGPRFSEQCRKNGKKFVKRDILKGFTLDGVETWRFDCKEFVNSPPTFTWHFSILSPERVEATHINTFWNGELDCTMNGSRMKPDDSPFLSQHGLTILPNNVIVTFDNGVYAPNDRKRPSRLVAFRVGQVGASPPYSRVEWIYTPPKEKQELYNRHVTGSAAPLPALFGSVLGGFGPVKPPPNQDTKYLVGVRQGKALFEIPVAPCWFVYGGSAALVQPVIRVVQLPGRLPIGVEIRTPLGIIAGESNVYLLVVGPYYALPRFSFRLFNCSGGLIGEEDALPGSHYWEGTLIPLPLAIVSEPFKAEVTVDDTTATTWWDPIGKSNVDTCQ